VWPHPIFVVNLPQAVERRAASRAQLESLGLSPTFVEAVNGRAPDLDLDRILDRRGRLKRAPKPLSPGEIGCYLSHWKILNRIVDEGIPQALVLEDDFVVTDELPPVLAALASRDLPNYDIVKLAISEPQTKSFEAIAPLTQASSLVRHHNVLNSTLAYVITREGAKRFLGYGMPIRYPVDVAMNRSWRHGMNILGVRPWPILPNLDFESMIGEARFSEAAAKAAGGVALKLERRLRKAYDSLAKRAWVRRRMAGDAAWRRAHSASST
jgi:glycosyl transferase, family 25